jgi:hypothetical protein
LPAIARQPGIPGRKVACHGEKRIEQYDGKKTHGEQTIPPADLRRPGESLNSSEVQADLVLNHGRKSPTDKSA